MSRTPLLALHSLRVALELNRNLLIRGAAVVCFAGMLIGGFQPEYLRSYRYDRAKIRAYFAELPYRKLPGFHRFLDSVEAQTKDGDAIALVIADRKWNEGYEYAFHRSLYLLPARQVLPIRNERDGLLPQTFDKAKYVACWKCLSSDPRFVVVVTSPDGTLAVRK